MAMDFDRLVFAWNSSEENAFWTTTDDIGHPFPLFVSGENKLYLSHFLRKFELVNLQIQLVAILLTVYRLTIC